MNRKTKAKPRRHSHRVAAWVYTVINPVIASLQREVHFLEGGNLTWRYYSRRCEYIRPVQEYVETIHWPNYDDFLADNREFAKEFLVHDNCLSHVESLAANVFDTLMHAQIFHNQVLDCLNRYEAEVSQWQQSILAQMKDDSQERRMVPLSSLAPRSSLAHMTEGMPKYVAEYLINNVESLPAHYSAQKFWQMFGHEFQSFKQRQSFASMSSAAQDLLRTSTKLKRSLEDYRLDLCRKFDVPAAPMSLPANVGSAF